MAVIDLHSKPFDDSTIAKLEIFEDYAQAWLPTFIMQGRSEIHIFDFFAGTGYDRDGVKGSPIRLLDKVKGQLGNIFNKKVQVVMHFNEFEPKKKQKKFDILKESLFEYLKNHTDINRAITLELYNEDCETLFPRLLPLIQKYPSLVYLDQNGIKFLSDNYFLKLEKTSETDFLYFVSSSYFWRFGDRDEFSSYFNLDLEEAKSNPYKFIHKKVLEEMKNRLPSTSKLSLYPYSLKKGSNIHGIVFGASHPRAVDKFLGIAWKRNKLNGEANFDINDDRSKFQQSLFGLQKTKLQEFEDTVEEAILSGRISNNFDLYNYTLDKGHIGKHSADVLRKLRKSKKIYYPGISPLVTYENVYKYDKFVKYQIIQ